MIGALIDKTGVGKMTKLVTILARAWNWWPNYSDCVEQTCLGDIFCSRRGRGVTFCNLQIAEDRDRATVTREMWEAERERINRDMYSGTVTTSTQWRGPKDGLPPVGSKGCTSGDCEGLGVDDIKPQIFIRWYDGETGVVPVQVFRPIRTDREKWIEASMKIFDNTCTDFLPARNEDLHQLFGAQFDAGLAKLPEDAK